MVWCKNCRALLGIELYLGLIHVSCVTSHFSSSQRVQLSIGIINEMFLFLIYFGVSGTNCTCEKASINIEAKQGTDLRGNCTALSGGPSPQISNFSNMGEALPPPSLESLLLHEILVRLAHYPKQRRKKSGGSKLMQTKMCGF